MIPDTELTKRISVLFGRRLTTPWSEKEVRRYKVLCKDFAIRIEDMDVIERYYVYQRKRENGIHRRDLYTFLNNFSGELDRAKAWDEEMRERAKRRERRLLAIDDSLPAPTSADDWQRIADLAKLELSRFREQFGAA